MDLDRGTGVPIVSARVPRNWLCPGRRLSLWVEFGAQDLSLLETNVIPTLLALRRRMRFWVATSLKLEELTAAALGSMQSTGCSSDECRSEGWEPWKTCFRSEEQPV